jgi:sec-independent protein translocase protein TatA
MFITIAFLNSLGGGEIFLILLVILLFFGANKIPELARGLGRGMREFKDAANDIQKEIESSAKPVSREINEIKQAAAPLDQVVDENPTKETEKK